MGGELTGVVALEPVGHERQVAGQDPSEQTAIASSLTGEHPVGVAEMPPRGGDQVRDPTWGVRPHHLQLSTQHDSLAVGVDGGVETRSFLGGHHPVGH